MAKGDTQTAEQIANGETPTEDQAATAEAAAKQSKPKTSIMVGTNVPLAMKELLDKLAETTGKTTAVWLREHLAQTVNYTLPIAIRKGRATNKYAGLSEAEKAAAVANDQKVKRQSAAALLAALEAGDLDVDLAAILAKYKPAERAPRAPKADEAAAITTESVPA